MKTHQLQKLNSFFGEYLDILTLSQILLYTMSKMLSANLWCPNYTSFQEIKVIFAFKWQIEMRQQKSCKRSITISASCGTIQGTFLVKLLRIWIRKMSSMLEKFCRGGLLIQWMLGYRSTCIKFMRIPWRRRQKQQENLDARDRICKLWILEF